MSDQPMAKPVCEHYYAAHVHQGLSIRFCMLCKEPDWDDLREQLAEARAEGQRAARPTYDSRVTGPRYHVTTRAGGRTVEFRKPLNDPFVRQTVTLGRGLVARMLRRRPLLVVVIVGGDEAIVDDVLGLDANAAAPVPVHDGGT